MFRRNERSVILPPRPLLHHRNLELVIEKLNSNTGRSLGGEMLTRRKRMFSQLFHIRWGLQGFFHSAFLQCLLKKRIHAKGSGKALEKTVKILKRAEKNQLEWNFLTMSRIPDFLNQSTFALWKIFLCKNWQVWDPIFSWCCDGFFWNFAYLHNSAW